MAIGYGKYIIVDRETKEKITFKKYREAENKLQELKRSTEYEKRNKRHGRSQSAYTKVNE